MTENGDGSGKKVRRWEWVGYGILMVGVLFYLQQDMPSRAPSHVAVLTAGLVAFVLVMMLAFSFLLSRHLREDSRQQAELRARGLIDPADAPMPRRGEVGTLLQRYGRSKRWQWVGPAVTGIVATAASLFAGELPTHLLVAWLVVLGVSLPLGAHGLYLHLRYDAAVKRLLANAAQAQQSCSRSE